MQDDKDIPSFDEFVEQENSVTNEGSYPKKILPQDQNEEQKKLVKIEKKQLQTDHAGRLMLTSLEDQLSFAKRLIDQEMVSSTFKTPQQLVVAFQYAKAMQMNEMIAIKMMYVVGGRPCLYGEGPLSLCLRTGLVEKIEEFYVDENIERISVENKNLNARVYASVTRIKRKGDQSEQEDYFTLDDLARAGIDKTYQGKKKETWEKWERIMLRYKARTLALRSKFADLIAGIPIAEYDYSFTPEEPSVIVQEKKKNIADELNSVYVPKEKDNSEQEAKG